MLVCHRTHQGLVRESNQDSLLIKEGLIGVADGMGGHNGGETASRVAVEVIGNALNDKEPDMMTLRMGIAAANSRIFSMACEDLSLCGMGTTTTVLWERGEEALIAHVGDSRAYLLRNGTLSQVTTDHSVVAELLRRKAITEEEAKVHPYRNVITRAVGTDRRVDVDLYKHDLQKGDLWLICSDGLYNMVDEEQMQKLLTESETDEKAADALLELALANGGTDNISFILARYGEEKPLC